MRPRVILLAACGAALAWAPLRAADDHQDVVFLGPKRPVVLRLHILIDGKPFRAVYQAAWDDYLKALFHQLDRDGDGFLSEAEGQRLPPPSQQIGGATSRPTNLAFNFRVVDTNGDGRIDLAEAATYYRDYGSAGLHLSQAPSFASIPPQVNDELFKRLDVDGDGKLSRAELAAASRLMELDEDGDELLSAPEILPRLFAAQNPAGRPLPVPPPAGRTDQAKTFVLLEAGEASSEMARRIRDRYGPAVTWPLPEPSAEMRIHLGNPRPAESPLEVVRVNDRSLAVRPTSRGLLLRPSDSDAAIEINVNDSRPALVARTRAQYLDQFHAADVGSKGHVTLKDAQLRNFFPQQFPLLDRDMDGKLTESELIDYLDQVHGRQAQAVTSVVSILASGEARGLFDLLDCNRDGRLGTWELRSAERVLDLAGGKEFLTRGESSRTYHLAIGLCQASFNRAGGHGVFTPRGLPMLALDWSAPELVWFDKMDRNRDGYLSLREFLGPEAAFRKLDLNGDGLISPEEARRAGVR